MEKEKIESLVYNCMSSVLTLEDKIEKIQDAMKEERELELADIRNKLGPISNLIQMIESNQMESTHPLFLGEVKKIREMINYYKTDRYVKHSSI